MKKAVVAIIAALGFLAPAVHAQTVNVQIAPECSILADEMTQGQEITCLGSLIQALVILQNALNAMQASSSAVATAPAPEIAATSTSAQTSGVGADVVDVPDTQPQIMQRTISVSFESVNDDGFVTITNDSGVAVRVKNLDVDGTLAGVTIGKKYGEGFVYAPSLVDSTGKTFELLACNGLGSLGQAILPGGAIDPCRRKDANQARNELQVGETMTLRYTGDPAPTGVTYQPGSIVEVGSGKDVTF